MNERQNAIFYAMRRAARLIDEALDILAVTGEKYSKNLDDEIGTLQNLLDDLDKKTPECTDV
jgi:hypothetical protein